MLVPEGAERLPQPLAVAGLMLAGGGAFMLLDRIQAKGKQAAPQFTAMAADFLPESLALGGMFAANPEGGVLLALLIGLQNLPEGSSTRGRSSSADGSSARQCSTPDGDACLARPRVRPDRLVLAGRSGRHPGGYHAVRLRRHSLSHVPGHRAAGAAGASVGRRRSAPCWDSRSRCWPRCCSTSCPLGPRAGRGRRRRAADRGRDMRAGS